MMVLPLPETLKAGTAASRIWPLPTLTPDGEVVNQDLFVGYFPGETTAMYAEQWRRRVNDELGIPNSLMVGYSQDHEGYLLIPEDWLVGGYESDITIWGPLQGEHIMEGVLQMGQEVLLSDYHEDPDPWKDYTPTYYWDEELPTIEPDLSPQAGTEIIAEPEAWSQGDSSRPEKLWLPPEFALNLGIPDQLPRVQGNLQFAWIGGDPAVDFPNVKLQRLEGETWTNVTTRSGRVVTEALPDILLGYTPDPLYPAESEQTHYWWATWQAVGPHHQRANLPLGTYRLHIDGQKYTGVHKLGHGPRRPTKSPAPPLSWCPVI